MIKVVKQSRTESTLRQTMSRRLEKRREIITGVMVGIDYTDDPLVASRPGYVWVREYGKASSDFGGVFQVFNAQVERRVDVPVFIGRSPKEPWQLIVLGVDWNYMSGQSGNAVHPFDILAHGNSHVLVPGKPTQDYGTDVVDITERNLGPGRVYATNPMTMTCVIAPVNYMYGTYVQYWQGGLTADFTAQIPGAALARMVFVCVDGATNLPAYIYSDTFAWLNYTDPVPSAIIHTPILQGYVLLSALILYNGMTEINERCFTYELRPLFRAVGNEAVVIDMELIERDPDGTGVFETMIERLPDGTGAYETMIEPL